MTVIATDGKTMAGDGLCCCGDEITNTEAVKISRLSDGRLFGSAGNTAEGMRVRQWIEDGANPKEFPRCRDMHAIVLNKDGTVDGYWQCGRGQPVRMPAPYALGSGDRVAIGALLAGKSPKQAVQIACDRITTCGGLITVLKL